MNNTFENLGFRGLNLDSFTNIEKGKKFPIGTISNGYKKIAEGKWHKVSEYGMTHIEHNDKSVTSGRQSIKYAPYSKMKEKKLSDSNFHREQADKLDDKEYDDLDVEDGGKLKIVNDIKPGSYKKGTKEHTALMHFKNNDPYKLSSHYYPIRYKEADDEFTVIPEKEDKKNKQADDPNVKAAVNRAKERGEKVVENYGNGTKITPAKKDDEEEGLKENANYDKFMENKKKVKDVIDERGNYKEGTTDIDKDGKLTLKKGNEFTSIPSFDDMQKSHITNMFGYGDSSIKIEKTGAEIKQSLEEIKSKNDIAKQSSYDKIELLVGEIGTQPTEECERYSMEGLEDKVGIMPKKYRWQEIYQDDASIVSNGLGISSQPTEQKPNEKKRAYNNEVDKYVDICVENIQLDTMINNINLTKKYSLTIKQASVLGF